MLLLRKTTGYHRVSQTLRAEEKLMFDSSLIETDTATIFTRLVKCYTDIDQIVVAQNPGDDKVEYYKHEFFKKMFRHSVSVSSLSRGTLIRFSDIEFESKDISAINLILRSSLEAFLLFHYIYADPTTTGLTRFRFFGWWREGLITRTKYSIPGVDVEQVRKRDLAEIEAIEKDLRTTKEYADLTPNQKISFEKNGNWKWAGWKEMLKKTKFSAAYKENVYSFLSSYAHSESVSLIQVKAMEHENKIDQFIKNSINMLVVINTVFLQYYWDSLDLKDIGMPDNDLNFIETWGYLGIVEPKKSG